MCCYLAGDRHYVLLTGLRGNEVDVFDPYDYPDFPSTEGVTLINDEPYTRNRCVRCSLFDETDSGMYALGEYEIREAVLLYNSQTRKSPEKTVEYFI